MSRRDTIIVAILVNAGLLMILFATAMRSDRKSAVEEIAAAPSNPRPTHEELIDQYLSVPTLGGCEELALAPQEASCMPAPQPSQAPLEDHAVSITVKKGDVLDKIAKANQTTVAAIMQLNHLSSTQLRVGQVLKIPGSFAKPDASVREGGPEEFYVVQEGDNPWLIASKNHLKLEDLLRLNQLDEQKARRIRPGERLRIR